MKNEKNNVLNAQVKMLKKLEYSIHIKYLYEANLKLNIRDTFVNHVKKVFQLIGKQNIKDTAKVLLMNQLKG